MPVFSSCCHATISSGQFVQMLVDEVFFSDLREVFFCGFVGGGEPMVDGFNVIAC